MNDDKIDLNDLANRHQLSIVSREDPVQRDSRVRIEEADAAHERRKDWLGLISALAGIGVGRGVWGWGIVSKGSATADKEWAILTAIVTGLLGYVVGRKAK